MLRSIRAKFIITVMIMFLISSFAVIFYWYSITSNLAENEAIGNVSERFKITNENMDMVLKNINSMVISLSLDKDIIIALTNESDANIQNYENKRKVDTVLRNLFNYNTFINGIMISDLDSQAYTSGLVNSYQNIITQPWFSQIMNANSLDNIIIPPHYYSKYSEWDQKMEYVNENDLVFSLARLIKSEYGETTEGIVMVDIKCKLLTDLFKITIDNAGFVFVSDKNTNDFIIKPPIDETAVDMVKQHLDSISEKSNSSQGNFYYRIDQRDYLVVYYQSPFTKWVTYGLIPKNMIMQDYNRTAVILILLSIFFCVAITAVTSMISSLLTRNLSKLTSAVKNVNRDNIDINIVIKSNDEVAELHKQFISMLKRIKELVSDIKTKEMEKRRSELKALQSQINPHFLSNTLNTIQYLASLQGVENIKKVSESLSSLMHINMRENNFITLKKEIAYLNSYIYIQRFIYSNKFVANIEVESGLDEFMLPKLLLQPIVENALVHGITPLTVQGIIQVKIHSEGKKLILRVQDNGPGLSSEKIKDILTCNNSIGLTNVLSRIRLYFGLDYGLSIYSEGYFHTSVEIIIPLISATEVDRYA